MKCQSKKIISIFLTFCMLMSLLSVTGVNANALTTDKVVTTRSEDFSYVLDNGKARIYHYYGTDTDLVIPSTIDGYTVK